MKSFALVCSAVLTLLLPRQVSAADPVSELAEFSVFGKVDPAALARGEIKTAAGPPMSTERYLSVQSCLVVPQPPSKVIEAMRRFDPTRHRDLKVFLHSDLPASPTVANFSTLKNAPNNSAMQRLRSATEKMAPDLQLSRAEAQQFASGQPPFDFWAKILAGRAQRFVAGGAAATGPYDHTNQPVQPGKELAGLVRQQGKVNRQFGGFLGSTGLLGGKGSLKPGLYWELLQVEDDGVLTLGASYSRATSGGGYQTADGLYYASGGYYVALTLYELWPIEIGGRASSLVWRGDFTSARSLGELHGIERLASEGAMRKNISKAVQIFKNENSR
jgi:hypothetical protein